MLLVEQLPRRRAMHKRDMLEVQYTRDAQWLMDRYNAIIESGTPFKPHTDEEAIEGWDKLNKFLGR